MWCPCWADWRAGVLNSGPASESLSVLLTRSVLELASKMSSLSWATLVLHRPPRVCRMVLLDEGRGQMRFPIAL